MTKWSDIIQSTQYINSWTDLWDWYKWLSWEWEVLIGLGVFGVLLILLRFLMATMPHTG